MAKSKKMNKRAFARRFVSKMVEGRNLMTKSGIKKEYNGWSNFETWGFMLIWENDYGYANFAEEIKSECADMDELKDRVRQEIEMILDDVQDYLNGGNDFVQQLCINATTEVDVDECVESICDGIEFDEDYEASTKKSQKASKMAKRQAVKKNAVRKDYYDATETVGSIKRILQSALNDLEYYDDNMKIHMRTSTYGLSSPILETSSGFMELYDISIDEDDYDEEDDEDYEASTKKSKYARLHKALNKIGGFTKEDDEEEIEIDDDDVVEIEDDEDGDGKVVEIESEETHAEEVADGEESESDNLNESCKDCKSRKARKAFRTSKRVKMKKGEDMPADADDFQNDNQKGSGNAGKELPEDADDQQEINEKGSGNAGKELPEDADEQEDQKQARARKQRMTRSRNKNVRKFSVTPGGSPNQESYAQKYPQAPMTRQAIDRHFSAKSEKSFDEVAMLQERIDNLNKSKRNKTNNGVPQKLRRY